MKIAGRLENYLFHYVLKTLQSQPVSEIPGTGVLFRTGLPELACREQSKWSLLSASYIRTPVTAGFKSQYSEFSMVVESFLQLPLNGRKCWRFKRGEIGAQQMFLQALSGAALPWANPGPGMDGKGKEKAQGRGESPSWGLLGGCVPCRVQSIGNHAVVGLCSSSCSSAGDRNHNSLRKTILQEAGGQTLGWEHCAASPWGSCTSLLT